MHRATSLIWIALPLVLAGCAAAPADTSDTTSDDVSSSEQPANFAQVRDGLYRGGHPSDSQLDYLKSIGVSTIVDLEIGDFIEATPWSISEEESAAKAKGFTFVRMPMSAFEPFVDDTSMMNTMTLLDDSSGGAIYVHCKHGQDRTGLVIGLERVLDESWAPADAYQEMLDHGFHPAFVGLKHYFDEKTGYDDDDN